MPSAFKPDHSLAMSLSKLNGLVRQWHPQKHPALRGQLAKDDAELSRHTVEPVRANCPVIVY
jgi:hypothetical protein